MNIKGILILLVFFLVAPPFAHSQVEIGSTIGNRTDQVVIIKQPTTTTGGGSGNNTNSSIYWGNYLWTDYDLPTLSPFWYNHTTHTFNLYDAIWSAMYDDTTLNATIQAVNNSASVWNKTGSDIFYRKGLVGINTVAPIYNLEVNGSFQADSYTSDDGNFVFNFHDDGSELTMNVTGVDDTFNIETENSKLVLYNNPVQANDFKVFQVFSKQAQLETEFTITKAGTGHTAYFVRSLALAGNGSKSATPFNCTTYADHLDCRTDYTGADLFVDDSAEFDGNIYVEGMNNYSYFANWLGLGTFTPSNFLDVRGDGNFSGTVYLDNQTDLVAQNSSYLNLFHTQKYIDDNNASLLNLFHTQSYVDEINTTAHATINSVNDTYSPMIYNNGTNVIIERAGGGKIVL